MYDIAYQLNSDPFRLSPDHRFCFNHRSYAKNKTYLEYALQRSEGFVMITGSPGSGKTTLLNDVLENAHRRDKVTARIVTTQLNADDLLRMVAFAFKIKIDGLDKAGVIQALENFLIEQFHRKKNGLLVIDEAQDLDKQALEEMRLLTNFQYKDHPLLQVFLVGQNNLLELVQDPAMAQLHQRMIASSQMEPMNYEETGSYIMHRLHITGWHHDPMITRGALKQIFLFSRGVPRIVNQFCSRFLLYGAVEKKHRLDSHDAQEVINELTQEHLVPVLDSSVLSVPPNEDYLDENNEEIETLDEQYMDDGQDPIERIIDELLYINSQHSTDTPVDVKNKKAFEKKTKLRSEKSSASSDIRRKPPVLTQLSGLLIEPHIDNRNNSKKIISETHSNNSVKESATSLLGSIKSLISILSEKIVKRHEIMSYINGVFIIALLVSFFILIFPDEPKQYSEKQVKSGAVRDDISLQHAKLNQQKSSQQNNTASPRKAKVILVSQPVNNSPLPVTANKVVEKTPTPNSQIHNKNKEMLPKLSSEVGNVENHNLVIAKAKPENPETTPEIVREKQENNVITPDTKQENTKSLFLPQYTTREMAKRDLHRLTINVDTQFARGSAELSPALQNRLAKLAKLLKNKNASVLHIIGYCDRTGSQERNIYLSVRRADAAANFLVNQGVSRNHIFTEGHGFSEPVSLTDAALNRRVEIFSKGVRPELASNVHSND